MIIDQFYNFVTSIQLKINAIFYNTVVLNLIKKIECIVLLKGYKTYIICGT